MLTHALCSAPQDIESDTTRKDSAKDDEMTKIDQPPSLSSARNVPEAPEPQDPSGVKNSPVQEKVLSPPAADQTPRTDRPPSPSGAKSSPSPTESSKTKTTPLSLQSHGPGAAGEALSQDDFTQPHTKTSKQTYSWVADSLAMYPDFIKAGFHFGRFMTTAMNTKVEHAKI
jgi:hypothetical protein